MATAGMVHIGAFDFYPDGPLGCTVGYNGAHGTDIHLFQEMIACGAVRVRLNIKPDLYAATSITASPSTWNWGFVDDVVLMANQNNIHVTLIARGFTPSNNTTFASWQETTQCSSGYNQTTIAGYTKIAVALARRYSGDGNPDNAKDSTGRALQADGIELGNEEINSMPDSSSLPYSGCRKAMRYVKLVRTVCQSLRQSSASGGGGWVPRGTFPARVGAWGIVHDQPTEIASTYGILTHPVLDATYNPSANSSSIFGFDGVLNTQMLDYANFHNYNPADGTGGQTPAAEMKQIRGILDNVGNTNIPVWCTEAGWDGPCNNVTETVQANYYAANADGSGGGALQALKDAGCQHWDIFTINYWGGSLNSNYVGQAMSIATKTSATGSPPNTYVHFLAETRIGNFMTNVDKGAWAAKAIPAGFGGSVTPPPTGNFLTVNNQQFSYQGTSVRLRGENFNNETALIIAGASDITKINCNNADYAKVASWGGNSIRWGMDYFWWSSNPTQFFNVVDQHIAWAKANRLWLYPVLFIAPDYTQGQFDVTGQATFWGSSSDQTAVVNFWTAFATRYKDEPTIAGYDILNEPSPNDAFPNPKWTNFAQRIYNAIAAIDANHFVIVEAPLSNVIPVQTGSRVAYSVHHYGTGDNYPNYPTGSGTVWSTNNPLIVGEFGGMLQDGSTAVSWVNSHISRYEGDGVHWTHFVMHEQGPTRFGLYNNWNAGDFSSPWTAMLNVVTPAMAGSVQPAGGGSSGGGGTGGGPTPGPYTGTLTGAFAPLASSTVNLTTEGTGDWAHWGVTGTTFDHDATGGAQISDATIVGNATAVQNPSALNSFTWTGGTPNAAETATATGIKTVPPTTTGGTGGGTGAPHVMVIALENHAYNNTAARYIVGNPNFPHINSLLSTYSTCTHFYADSHPSLPNYLAFASGSDYGIANDTYNPATSPLAGNTLVDSLKTAGIAWKHYAENLPSTGYLGGDSGSYIQHHNPWVYFKTIRSNSAQYTNIVNYTQLATDLAAGTAPPFIFVQPNNNDNGHNSGTDTTCDNFVNSLVTSVQASTWYTANSGIIVLWWDESNPDADTAGIGDKGSNGAYGGHIACCVISALNSAVTFTPNVNHYGFLHALEKLYGLPYLGKSTNSIDGDLTPLFGTTSGGGGGGGGPATSNLGNGFTLTAPADTNPRTLNVYTDVNQGIATLAASLSDNSAPDFYDSNLQDSSGGAATSGVYTLSYAASGTGKTLYVTYTLSDNLVPGITSGADTFTRANQSGLGTASDTQVWTLVTESGAPAWSIASNQGKLTGSALDTGVALLGSHTLLDGEAVGIVNLSDTASSAGLVIRSNSGGTTYYRASLSGSAILLYYVTGGVSTQLSIQPATLKINTNYWLRFRAVKSSLYARYWPADGSAEPKNWHIVVTDTSIATAGKFGLRGMLGATSDIVLFDTFSVVDLSATGDPSYVSLYAADLPTSVTTSTGVLSVSTSTPTGTIDLTTEGVGDYAHWGYAAATGFDHKAGVVSVISDFTPIGSGTYTQNTSALLAWSWEDGTPDNTAVASTTETIVTGVANGYSFSVPADTTSRTLNVYVAAKKAQGTFTATLSDSSATAYSDTSLNDTGTGTVKKYALTYNAATANQTLTITWTMLVDNGAAGSLTTYSTDSFVRADQSGWGNASDGTSGAWVQVAGSAVPSIVSNKGKVTAASGGQAAVMLLGTGTQTNAEALVRYQVSATASNISPVLRSNSTGTTYYRAQIDVNGLAFVKVVGGTNTTLATAAVTLVANTNYWLRFRLDGSNLYARYWQDGSSEPATWTLTFSDSSISGAGQYGLRSRINTAGDSALMDSYTLTNFGSGTGGTPGNIALAAASTPDSGGILPPPPPPPPPPPAPGNTIITVKASDAVLPKTWLGMGVQQDPYTQGTGAALTISSDQRNLINTRLNFMRPPLIRTCADSVSWWCPTGVVGTYDFTNALMQEWYTVFDNAQAQGYSVIVAVNSPAPFTTLSSSWCTAFADLIDYLINTLGYTCIRYVSGLSEPDLN